MDFLDNETALPQIMQGEQGGATDVLGGMNILLNQSNVMQRRKLKCFDDQVTIPHIGRYVDWNIQYNPKSEIKGDFEVQARASGALMDTEIQNRMVGGILGLVTNPAFAYGMKKWDAVRRMVRAGRFDPKDFVKTDEEIERIEAQMKQQPPPPAPAIAAAQIRAQSAEKIEGMRAKEEADHHVADAALAMEQMKFEQSENELERQNRLAVAVIDERLKSTELTSNERQTLDKIKAELAQTSMKLSVTKDMAVAQHTVDVHKHRNPVPKPVISPAIEPAGRAQPGKSFQQ
jgi:hypothetical protein